MRLCDMVTMSSDKSAARRKADTNNGGGQVAGPATTTAEDTPNHLVYKKVSFWLTLKNYNSESKEIDSSCATVELEVN